LAVVILEGLLGDMRGERLHVIGQSGYFMCHFRPPVVLAEPLPVRAHRTGSGWNVHSNAGGVVCHRAQAFASRRADQFSWPSSRPCPRVTSARRLRNASTSSSGMASEILTPWAPKCSSLISACSISGEALRI